MSENAYPKFGKIPRLHRDVIITEKIDGTNGLIEIVEIETGDIIIDGSKHVATQDADYLIRAGSRSRWISPEQDNHGFAKWVSDNAETLVADLGPGLHYGEWWGKGIGKRYSQVTGGKYFSLFNTGRWGQVASEFTTPNLGIVPIINEGNAADLNQLIGNALEYLTEYGSVAAPGCLKAEGIIIYHSAANSMFKVTLEKDEEFKGANRVS